MQYFITRTNLFGLFAVLLAKNAAKFSLKNSTISDWSRDFLFPVQAVQKINIYLRI